MALNCEVFEIENLKVLFLAVAVYLSSDITRDIIIFSVKQLGLQLIVLLKIMVSPVLYITIDTRQLLKRIPLYSKYQSCNWAKAKNGNHQS